MKNILLLLLFSFSLFASAQSYKTIKEDQVYAYQYANEDSVIKDGSKTLYFYVKDFAVNVKYETTLTRLSGDYTKARIIIYNSIDATNWVAFDTLSFAGTGSTISTVSDLKTNVYTPYLKISVLPYDSIQTVKAKHYLLIDKN